MRATIHVCAEWRDVHERPVYTFDDRCPACGGPAVNSAPAPFSPEDPNGEHRRALKRRERG